MKTNLPYEKAITKALGFVDQIAPFCERVEIAGSLRRRKPEIGDIEIVAIAKTEPAFDIFGNVVKSVSRLEQYLSDNFAAIKNGPHYKQFPLDGIMVDLFITSPAQWGVIFAIRTGSADFSKWLVTWRRNGGALPGNMFVREGRLCLASGPLETPEEIDFFRAIGLDWIPPEERIEGRWRR
jgi:DNA polymerase/3'-5' exonuclease PolX